jgi:hypothetical protein
MNNNDDARYEGEDGMWDVPLLHITIMVQLLTLIDCNIDSFFPYRWSGESVQDAETC